MMEALPCSYRVTEKKIVRAQLENNLIKLMSSKIILLFFGGGGGGEGGMNTLKLS